MQIQMRDGDYEYRGWVETCLTNTVANNALMIRLDIFARIWIFGEMRGLGTFS